MNLKMNRSILLDEIVKANKIIDPKNINPEMLGVLVIVEPERVIFTSTNGSLN
jgi:DNA polymerase-3 subunit beta